MVSVFLDANVFFAAVRSRTGGSYFVIELAKRNRLHIVTVAHALAEAERNISNKMGVSALQQHYDNLAAIRPKIQSLVSVPVVLEYRLRSCVVEKDIPIVLGAILSEAAFLLTLDRRHLLHNEKLIVSGISVSIVTPGDFLQLIFPKP